MNVRELIERLSAFDPSLSVEVEGFGLVASVETTDYDEDGRPNVVLKGGEEPLTIDFGEAGSSKDVLRMGGAALMALGGDASGLASVAYSEKLKFQETARDKLRDKLKVRKNRGSK